MDVDLLRMSDAEIIKLVSDLGGRVQYFPMVAVPSIESVARGEHHLISSDYEWLPLNVGAERLLLRSKVLHNFDPLKNNQGFQSKQVRKTEF